VTKCKDCKWCSAYTGNQLGRCVYMDPLTEVTHAAMVVADRGRLVTRSEFGCTEGEQVKQVEEV
jgi:hypothetical protein